MKRVISVFLVLLLAVPVLAVAVCAAETGGDTLTWDGNTDGVKQFDFEFGNGIMHYKISDKALSLEDLEDGVILGAQGNSMFVPLNSMFALVEDVVSPGDLLVIFVFDDVVAPNGNILEKGIYFGVFEGQFVESLTIPGYTGFSNSDAAVSKFDMSTIHTGISTFTDIIGSFFDLVSSNPLFCALFAGALIMTCIPLYVSLRKNSH